MFLKLPEIIIYYKSIFRGYKNILKEDRKNKCSYEEHTLNDSFKLLLLSDKMLQNFNSYAFKNSMAGFLIRVQFRSTIYLV